MKNINILKTDKPSRLLKDLVDGTYQLKKEVSYGNRFELPLNIYIISDEEIKDVRPHKGKWQLEKGEILNKFPDYLTDLSECKLVIMTTDQSLDGVQAIDDEFLEWFVENPSCKEVEIEINSYMDKNISDSITFTDYKIIIPKEEPKKETLEEYIEKSYPKDSSIYDFTVTSKIRNGIRKGAKWQQEQNKNLYNKEDLWESYKASNTIFEDKIALRQEFEKWFIEQFKNK